MRRRRPREIGKSVLCGAIGGALGTAAMGLYWKAVVAAVGSDPRQARRSRPGSLDDIALDGQHRRGGESATEAVGRIAHEALTGEPPETGARKKTLSQAVHWGYGTAQGALYGALRGRHRAPDFPGAGALGTALWGFSEVGLPVLGLGKGPTAYRFAHHAATWGAHLVYGLVVAAAAQTLRRAL